MKKSNKKFSSLLSAAAFVGLMTGAASLASCSGSDAKAEHNGCNGPNGCGAKKEANSCKGHNSCKAGTEEKKN